MEKGKLTFYNKIFIHYRVAWWFYIKATGNVGHGSSFTENTATEKLVKKSIHHLFPFLVKSDSKNF